LLWAFQRIFMANPKRAKQPYNCAHHPVLKERLITVAICLLLIGTGFYTTPWLNFIDQDAAAIGRQFPMHGAQLPSSPPFSNGEVSQPSDADAKDGQHE